MGLQRNRRVAPAEGDVRVMTFGLSEIGNTLHKFERVRETVELESAFDAVRLIEQSPLWGLTAMRLGLVRRERWNAAAAGRARFRDELFGLSGHGAILQG